MNETIMELKAILLKIHGVRNDSYKVRQLAEKAIDIINESDSKKKASDDEIEG